MNGARHKFIRKSPLEYEFSTQYGAYYVVNFLSAASYIHTTHPFKDYFYSIDIDCMAPGPYNQYDYMIGVTVAEILLDFWS